MTGTVITAHMVRYVKTFNTSLLTVAGTAKQVVTSDEVKWTGSYFTYANSNALAAGYARLAKDRGIVAAFLEGRGVAAQDVSFMPVAMNQNFVTCKLNPKACGPVGFTSYQLIQAVRVQSPHVHRITALAQDTGALIKQGVVFTTGGAFPGAQGGIQYYYDKLPQLRTKLLAAATQDARKRAERIAASTGGRVGRLVSLTVEPFQLTSLHSTQVSNAGAYSTTTIHKKLTAIVRATFRLP